MGLSLATDDAPASREWNTPDINSIHLCSWSQNFTLQLGQHPLRINAQCACAKTLTPSWGIYFLEHPKLALPKVKLNSCTDNFWQTGRVDQREHPHAYKLGRKAFTKYKSKHCSQSFAGCDGGEKGLDRVLQWDSVNRWWDPYTINKKENKTPETAGIIRVKFIRQNPFITIIFEGEFASRRKAAQAFQGDS